MTRGFIRLSVVVILLTWMGAAFFQWRHLEADIWHIERHISPYLRGEMSGLPITKREWPAYAATPGFLALSEKERVQVAAEFYESHVRWLEREYFVGHEDALKKWFVKTARLGVNEAPVQYFFAAGLHEVPFRNFGVTGIAIAPLRMPVQKPHSTKSRRSASGMFALTASKSARLRKPCRAFSTLSSGT